MLAVFLVSYSTFGMRLRAVRDDETAATGLGLSVFRYRFTTFILFGGLSGVVGGLIAFQQSSFEPSGMLGLNWSINALLMTVVGPIIGTVVVYYILTRLLSSYDALSVIIEGALLVIIIRFAPAGLWPTALRLLRRRRRSTSQTIDEEASAPANNDRTNADSTSKAENHY